MAPADTAEKRKGVAWQQVNPKSLGTDLGKLHSEYVRDYERAKTSGDTLKHAIQREWDERYPDGIGGKRWAFNVINGTVLYAPVELKPRLSARRRSAETGADAFPLLAAASTEEPKEADQGQPATEPKPNPVGFMTEIRSHKKPRTMPGKANIPLAD